MRIEQHGLNAVISGLNRLRGRLENTTPLMHQIGQMLSNSTVERFHTKTDPDGSAWKPLKPATIARKGHDNILVAKGDMMDSITFSSDSLTALITSSDKQGKVAGHQFGNPSKNLPKRAIFGLSQGDKADIENIVTLWLEESL